MANVLLVGLIILLCLQGLIAAVTLATPADHRLARGVRGAWFAVVSVVEGMMLWRLGAGVAGVLALPTLGLLLGLQGRVRLPLASELVYAGACLGCVVGITALTTPSTTWGDGYKLVGLLVLPPSLVVSTAVFHQLRWRRVYGVGKIVVAVGAVAGCVWGSTLVASDFFGDTDAYFVWLGWGAALLQLVEGIAALARTRPPARRPMAGAAELEPER
jgi:hypothetical protein